jgi:methyl-accepting chemotaxis protein
MLLTTRITSIAVLILLLVIGSLISIGLVTREQMEEQIKDALFSGNSVLWSKLQEEQYQGMAQVIESLEDEYELRTALKKGRYDEVQTYADRFVELTAGIAAYDHLLVFSKDKSVVYESTETNIPQYLEQMLSRVEDEKQSQQGVIDLGNGRVVNVYVDHARTRKKIIGYYLLINELSHSLDKLSDNLEQSVAISGINDMPIYETPAWIEQAFGDSVYSELDQPIQTLYKPEKSYLFTRQPINNVVNNQVANLLIAVEDTENLQNQRRFDFLAIGIVMVITLLGLMSLSYTLKRYLAPLRFTAEAASKIANGNLDIEIEVRGVGEIAQLEQSMQRMVMNLREMVREIGHISNQINTSTMSVDTNMTKTHQSIGMQNQNIDAISQRLEDIAGSVTQVAENTTEAANTATLMQQESMGSRDLMKIIGIS